LQEEVDELAGDLQELGALRAETTKPGSTCDRLGFSFFGWTGLQPRARAACRKISADRGAGLVHSFIDNLPKTMFVFLPLLALVRHWQLAVRAGPGRRPSAQDRQRGRRRRAPGLRLPVAAARLRARTFQILHQVWNSGFRVYHLSRVTMTAAALYTALTL